jgi:hypothetical protein
MEVKRLTPEQLAREVEDMNIPDRSWLDGLLGHIAALETELFSLTMRPFECVVDRCGRERMTCQRICRFHESTANPAPIAKT